MDLYISETIKKYGLTQQKIAERMGVSLQTVKSTLYNKNPTLATLVRFAEAINCDPREFFYNPKVDDFTNVFKSDRKEKVISTFTSNETGKKYKIVEIEE